MHIIHCTIISNNWNIFYKRSTGYNYFAGVIVITLVAAVIALAVTLGVEMGKDTNQMGPGTGEQTGDDVCLTDGCIQLSAQIAASMNQSVDPCEDFYEFSCGNWIRNNAIDPGMFMIILTNGKVHCRVNYISELIHGLIHLCGRVTDDFTH